MKPFYAIDITEDKKSEQLNGQEFVIATVSSAKAQMLSSAAENMTSLVDKAKLPLPLRIIQTVCGFAALLVAVGIMRGLGEVTIAQAYENAGWLFWMAGVCAIVWLVLFLMARKQQSQVLESDETRRTTTGLETLADGIYTDLNVPKNAPDTDILFFRYKLKDGEPDPKTTGMDTAPYNPMEFKAFVQDGNLCLANLENKYGFPLSELRRIRTVKKHICMVDWNKETEPTKEPYKQYKMSTDNYSRVHMKTYYILELEHSGETWGIWFPCYELPIFQALTGLTAEAE